MTSFQDSYRIKQCDIYGEDEQARLINILFQQKNCLRGGGCGFSAMKDVQENRYPPLPINLGTKLKKYTAVLSEKASLAMDENQKEEILIAIQWFYFNKQHFNTLCFQYLETSRFYALILDCLDQLLKQSSVYLRASGVLCVHILEICNDLIRVIFSFLIKDKSNTNRCLEFNYKEQLQQHLNRLETLLEVEASNVWVTGIQFELSIINTALEHCPTNSTKKDELLCQFMNGMFESIFQLSPSQELIKALIEIGSKIIMDEYNKYFKHKIRKYEIYYFFETLKWAIITQLGHQYSVLLIKKSLEEGYKKYVAKSKDWLIHFCWLKMMSEILSFRPIIDREDKNLQENCKKQWNYMISNKQLVPLQHDRNMARILFKLDEKHGRGQNLSFSFINQNSYYLFYSYLMNQEEKKEIKLWSEYVTFTFDEENEKQIMKNQNTINQFLFGNFEVQQLQHQSKLLGEIQNEFNKNLSQVQKNIENFQNESEKTQELIDIYVNDLKYFLKILKEKAASLIQLNCYQKFYLSILVRKFRYVNDVFVQHKLELQKKKEDKNLPLEKKQSYSKKIKCYEKQFEVLSQIMQSEKQVQSQIDNAINKYPKIIEVITILEDEEEKISTSLYKQQPYKLQRTDIILYQKELSKMNQSINDFQKQLLLLQKSQYVVFQKNFEAHKQYVKITYQKFYDDIKIEINVLESTFKLIVKEFDDQFNQLNNTIKQNGQARDIYYKIKQFYNHCYFLQKTLIIFKVSLKQIYDGIIAFLHYFLEPQNKSQCSFGATKEKIQNQQINQDQHLKQKQHQRINEYFTMQKIDQQIIVTNLLILIEEFKQDQRILNNLQKNLKEKFAQDIQRTFQTIQFLLDVLHLKTIDSDQKTKILELYKEQESYNINQSKDQANGGGGDLKQKLNTDQTKSTQQSQENLKISSDCQDENISEKAKNNSEILISEKLKINLNHQLFDQPLKMLEDLLDSTQALMIHFQSNQYDLEYLNNENKEYQKQLQKKLIDRLTKAQNDLDPQLKKVNQQNFFKQNQSIDEKKETLKQQETQQNNKSKSMNSQQAQQIQGKNILCETIHLQAVKLYFNTVTLVSGAEILSGVEINDANILNNLRQKLQKKMVKQKDIENQSSNSYKVRECLAFYLTRIQFVVPETSMGLFCQKIIQDIWVKEQDGRVKKLLLNKEMINLQKKLFSQDLHTFSERLKKEIDAKFEIISQFENKLSQEEVQKKKEEVKKDLIKEYDSFEKYIDGITEMAQKLDLNLLFLKEIRQKLGEISTKVDEIQKNVLEIGKDLRKLKGKSYKDLLDIRKENVMQQQEQYELRNIYIQLKTQEWNASTGQKIPGKKSDETYLLSEDKDDTEAEVNEFLMKDTSKDVLLIRGNAGSGKSRAAKKIEEYLWKGCEWTPIFVSLPTIKDPRYNLIQQALQSDFYRFDQVQIKEFMEETINKKKKVVLILDSYDEIKQEFIQKNLYLTNRFRSEFKMTDLSGKSTKTLKLIFTTRNEILTSKSYQIWFCGYDVSTLKEVEILSFDKSQNDLYLEEFSLMSFKRIFLDIYEFFLQSQKINFVIENFNIVWKKVREIINTKQQSKKSEVLLAKEQVSQFISYIKQQPLFSKASEVQITNLTKELNSLWSVSKFQNTIKNINISQILTTPFMMEIVVQVLPNMILEQTKKICQKDYFIENFISAKLYQIKKKLFLKNFQQKQLPINLQYPDEERLKRKGEECWELLEKVNFFHFFSLDTFCSVKEEQYIIISSEKLENQVGNTHSEDSKNLFNEQIGKDSLAIIQALKQNTLTSYDFYENFVRFYHSKQIEKLRQQGKKYNYESLEKDLFYFSENLAMDFTRNQQIQLCYNVKGKLQLKKTLSSEDSSGSWEDYYFNDFEGDGEYKKIIRSCVLINQKGNNFSFSHKSVQEFFVAKQFIELLLKLQVVEKKKQQSFLDLTKEEKLLPNQDSDIEGLKKNKKITDNFSQRDYKFIYTQYQLILKSSLNQAELNLSLEKFQGCLRLMKHKLQNISSLKEILIWYIKLSAQFPEMIKAASNNIFILSYINEYLGDTNFQKIQISDTKLYSTSFFQSNLSESSFYNVDINQCNFNCTNLSGVKWQNITLKSTYTLRGHKSQINDIKCFQNIYAASCGDDALVIIWNLRTFKQEQRFTFHTKRVNQLEIFDNEKKLASVGDDKFLMIYSLEANKFEKISSVHCQNPLYSVSFISQQSNKFFVGGSKNQLILIPIKGEEFQRIEKGPSDPQVIAQSVSQDQSLLAIGVRRSIKLYELLEREKEKKIANSTIDCEEKIYSLKFFSNNELLASGGEEKILKIWNVLTGTQMLKLEQGQSTIFSIAIDKDEIQDRDILAYTDGQCLKIFDAQAGKIIKEIKSHQSYITTVVFAKNNLKEPILLYGSDDNFIRYTSIESVEDFSNQDAHQAEITSLSVSPDGLTIASGSNDNTIKLWELETGKLQAELIQHTSSIAQVKFSKNNEYLASISEDEVLYVWDAKLYSLSYQIKPNVDSNNNKIDPNLQKNKSKIVGFDLEEIKKDQENCNWSAQNLISCLINLNEFTEYQFAYGDFQGNVLILNKKYKYPIVFCTHQNQVTALDFTKKNQTIASGSADGYVNIFCLKTLELKHLINTNSPILALKVFKETDEFLTGHKEGLVQKFSFQEDYQREWNFGEDDIVRISILEEDQKAFIGSQDSLIYLINFKNDEYDEFNEEVTLDILEISQQAKYLASSKNADLFIWNLENKNCKRWKKIHQEDITALCFTDDEKNLAVGGADDLIILWFVHDFDSISYLGTFYGHHSSISTLFFVVSKDFGQILVSSSQDVTIRFWDIKEQNQVYRLKIPNDKTCKMCQFNQTNKLAILSLENQQATTLTILDIDNGLIVEQIDFFISDDITSISISQQDELLAIATCKETLILLQINNGWAKESVTFKFQIRKIHFSYFSKNLLYILKNDSLAIFDCSIEKEKRNAENIVNEFNNCLVSFSKGVSKMAYCKKSSLGYIDLETRNKEYLLRCKDASLSAFSSTQKGDYFATGKINGIITIWNVESQIYYSWF